MIRFSQREVFDDQRDLRPEVPNFGTAQEIRAFMDNDPVLARYAPALKEAVIGGTGFVVAFDSYQRER
jgi:hypothetical protein